MKLNLSFKKIIGFKPELHWKIILVITQIIFVIGVAYSVYLYIFAKKQIENIVLVKMSSASKLTNLESPEKIQEYFNVYKNRDKVYKNMLSTFADQQKNIVATSSTSSTTVGTSTIVATSTKQ